MNVACASRDDRHIPVPWVREMAVVTLYVIGEAFEYVSFADVCGARFGAGIPDHIDSCGADQFNQVDVTKSLKFSADCVHRLSPATSGLLSHQDYGNYFGPPRVSAERLFDSDPKAQDAAGYMSVVR